MIFYFKRYIIRTFGADNWQSIVIQDEFYNLYYNLVSKHGETVFGELVYLAVKHLDVPYKDMVTYFDEYRKKVEKLQYDDFALLG
jgi:hypothetical protein